VVIILDFVFLQTSICAGTEWSLSCALSGSSGKEDRVQWLNLLEASCSDDSGISPDDALPLQCKATIDPSNRKIMYSCNESIGILHELRKCN